MHTSSPGSLLREGPARTGAPSYQEAQSASLRPEGGNPVPKGPKFWLRCGSEAGGWAPGGAPALLGIVFFLAQILLASRAGVRGP